MSLTPTNDIFKKQQSRLVRATFKRAVISNVNVLARTANIYFTENPQTIIKNVPLALHITASAVLAGQQARVDIFDETKANSMVIAYLF